MLLLYLHVQQKMNKLTVCNISRYSDCTSISAYESVLYCVQYDYNVYFLYICKTNQGFIVSLYRHRIGKCFRFWLCSGSLGPAEIFL
jgi:hypothetical protein